MIVDIQPHDEFVNHHFKNSIETNAFPVKSSEDKAKLDKIIPSLLGTKNEIVIVCPRGKGGALNAYEYLKSKNVPENRLYILEGGIAGWPYKEMLERNTTR